MAFQVFRLDHLVLTVRDIGVSSAWYERALGMQKEWFTASDGGVRTALRFGNQKINLHQAGGEFAPHAALPTPGSADLCFLTQTPLDAVQRHLDESDIPIELGPVRRNGATGPIRSLYIRDPDGNLIEISTSEQ